MHSKANKAIGLLATWLIFCIAVISLVLCHIAQATSGLKKHKQLDKAPCVFAANADAQEETAAIAAVNSIESYLVRWWGTEGSERSRPTYSVTHIDNGQVEIRYTIVPGRELDDYTMPYWHIRSFLSILNRPAELAHCGYAEFSVVGELNEISFVPQSGSEFATVGEADVLKIKNRTADSPEGRDKRVTNPLLMEHIFIIGKKSPTIQVLARFTNTGEEPLKSVITRIVYEQSFNWSDFGVADGKAYQPVQAPMDGTAPAFFAFSSGMQRGYEFIAGENCLLSYRLSPKMNKWQVTISCKNSELAPDVSVSFRYVIRAIDSIPTKPKTIKVLNSQALLALCFRQVQPAAYKSAPIKLDGRVMLPQLIGNIEQPKIRGLNLRAGFPQALEDLQTLKDWGCNLVIVAIGNPDHTLQLLERGHRLGMEMFVSGHGSYRDGSPNFDGLYKRTLPLSQQADSHGQDEDHYYWYSIKPTRYFEVDFGKPMAEATQDEKVLYWSQCFFDKWNGVLTDVRKKTPGGGIWFYMPAPGIANIDPLDYYDIFFNEVARLGEALTVFPFYYGVEYNQAEYMCRRWRDAGVHRIAFLPMRDFMSRPSQFFRAITAARRGQADGTCGFSFAVGAETPEKTWQWKSVMLAAWTNFPTPELNAYCFVEEPAELVEALAISDVMVVSDGTDIRAFLERLNELLPGKAQAVDSIPKHLPQNRLVVVVGDRTLFDKGSWPYDLRREETCPGKGVIQMQESIVSLCGTDPAGIANAMKLFSRFAELARDEGQKIK